MSIVSSLVGGILGANASNNAANAEEKGAQQAQAISQQNQTNANQNQQNVLATTTAAEQPYQTLGSTSANSLNNLLQQGFQAPTLQQAESTPGYQFQLQQGTQAIDQNAAANGTLLTGNTGTALQNYGQNLAQTAYQNTYNDALNTYMSNYNTLQGGVNSGLTSTGQVAQAGQAAANNISNTDLNAANQQGAQVNNAAAARASGYLNSAAAYGNMLGAASNGFGNLDTTGGSSALEQLGNFAFA
ncbi:MAG TPA: hypothetical protein VGG46_04080 [Terriglobales bacterium]|jgi:hypothetical protein